MKYFSGIAALLTKWLDVCEEGFVRFNECLTSAPDLLPLGPRGYTLYCDASRVGLGCVLLQYERIVAHASR